MILSFLRFAFGAFWKNLIFSHKEDSVGDANVLRHRLFAILNGGEE